MVMRTDEQLKQDAAEIVRPTVGRIVNYVLADGVVRPAIVVHVWPSDVGSANLQVFTDGSNDDRVLHPWEQSTLPTGETPGKTTDRVVWRTSIAHDPGRRPGTWHWPTRT